MAKEEFMTRCRGRWSVLAWTLETHVICVLRERSLPTLQHRTVRIAQGAKENRVLGDQSGTHSGHLDGAL